MQENKCINGSKAFTRSLKLMGNRFEITAVASAEEWANTCIDAAIAEIQRIEKLLTTFNEESETCQINKYAGISPVQVSEETFQLIRRSVRISKITQGAFDISYGSVDKDLWNFNIGMKSLPDKETAAKMVRLINYRNIILDEENLTVFLKEPGMRIGFGGIGKGYAADRAKMIMKEMGMESGIINASGDLAVWGTQPGGEAWTIGIVNPNMAGEAFSYFKMKNMAVATSGSY